jgi:ABC-type glycerol-3-phosphate transport system substrate-binding protein
MKKIGVLLFVFVLFCTAALVFTGCKGDKNQGKTVVTIGNYPLDTDVDSRKMWDRWIEQHHKKYPNVRIVPSKYDYSVDTFVPMAQGGGLPTLFITYFTEPDKLIASGLLRDIAQEVQAFGWDTKISGFARNLLVRDGKIYGLPSEAYALGLHLNMDLFRKAGLVDSDGLPLYPRTWGELAIAAKTIKDKTGKAGLCLLAKDNAGGWHFTNIAWGFGATFAVERDGKWIAQVNTPEAAAALQYVKDLKWVFNALTPDPTNEDWGTGFAAIGSGVAAMYIAGPGGSGAVLA